MHQVLAVSLLTEPREVSGAWFLNRMSVSVPRPPALLHFPAVYPLVPLQPDCMLALLELKVSEQTDKE